LEVLIDRRRLAHLRKQVDKIRTKGGLRRQEGEADPTQMASLTRSLIRSSSLLSHPVSAARPQHSRYVLTAPIVLQSAFFSRRALLCASTFSGTKVLMPRGLKVLEGKVRFAILHHLVYCLLFPSLSSVHLRMSGPQPQYRHCMCVACAIYAET
jgi:hypothetical protein